MKKSSLLFFYLFPFFSALCQKQTIRFQNDVFDYGDVIRWNNPSSAFVFTNEGSNEILFLPTRQREDIFVEVPTGKIKTGQSDTVFIYYFTSDIGEFQKSVELFTSASNAPIKLAVKGNILSLDPNAFMSCPGFAPKIDRVDGLALILDSLSSRSNLQDTGQNTMIFEKLHENSISQSDNFYDGVLPINQYVPNNIVFLIDVSSSMKKPNKLPLLKTSMKKLTNALRKVDYISVITYSTSSSVMLTPTLADNKEKIISLIDTLTTSGRTNGVKGLQTAYDIAEQNFIQGGNNQIIIATDGLFNNPDYSENDLFSMVRLKAKEDVILSVIGFGQDEDALKMMKRLAEKGNGSFMQIHNTQAANEILIEEIKLQSAINKQ